MSRLTNVYAGFSFFKNAVIFGGVKKLFFLQEKKMILLPEHSFHATVCPRLAQSDGRDAHRGCQIVFSRSQVDAKKKSRANSFLADFY
ncbi:MAG TPA: hypothetical protein VG754_14420 [Verrucomicrobiae bacterium]|nr:hypothetical protein [Verrucomicrobiae bacterium]